MECGSPVIRAEVENGDGCGGRGGGCWGFHSR